MYKQVDWKINLILGWEKEKILQLFQDTNYKLEYNFKEKKKTTAFRAEV